MEGIRTVKIRLVFFFFYLTIFILMINQNLLHPFLGGMKNEKKKKNHVWTYQPHAT